MRQGREAFERDELIQVWVVYHLQLIGEAARGLGQPFRTAHPEIPWAEIVAMRNILVHDYSRIDQDEVWATVERDLPRLKQAVQAILDAAEAGNPGHPDDGSSLGNACCGREHPFDSRQVRTRWWPGELRCLIVGESPGTAGSAFFYDPIPRTDPVGVRRLLLPALAEAEIIRHPTLEDFREAGFLFDHVVRCPLSMRAIARERQRAQRYRSVRAAGATHLRGAIEAAPKIWAMGHIARNAVADLFPRFPRTRRRLTPPYAVEGRVFVSRYLRPRFDSPEAARRVVATFERFLNAQ